MRVAAWLLVTAGLAGCAPAGPDVVRPADPPAAEGAGEPNLVAGDDGRLYLSWIEPADSGHALRFSVWQGGDWSVPRTIARGEDWFVNWADFPSMAAAADGTLAAHWLARSGEATYAYDVRVVLSTDAGDSWSEAITPHGDGTQTEHGFVSIVPAEEPGAFDLVWLDGREMALDEDGGVPGTGAMTLRSGRLDRRGELSREQTIDERVCDCCQTDALRGPDGALVTVFRDRSETEVRDISVARQLDGGWSAPVGVHRDGWVIAACPVNGPALAQAGDTVAAAWFTAGAEAQPAVLVGFSGDGGASFDEPLRVDGGKPVGRVDVELLDDGRAVVSWLERGAVRLRWVGRSGPLTDALVVARTVESRASGFPRLARHGGELFLAWTEPGERSRVHVVRLPEAPPS